MQALFITTGIQCNMTDRLNTGTRMWRLLFKRSQYKSIDNRADGSFQEEKHEMEDFSIQYLQEY